MFKPSDVRLDNVIIKETEMGGASISAPVNDDPTLYILIALVEEVRRLNKKVDKLQTVVMPSPFTR